MLYKVTTAYAGCDDEIFKTVYIKPVIDLASDDYFENFEDGSSDWTFDYEAVNNWKFGTPDRSFIKRSSIRSKCVVYGIQNRYNRNRIIFNYFTVL